MSVQPVLDCLGANNDGRIHFDFAPDRDPSLKRTMCKACDTILIPGLTARVRVKSERLTCLTANNTLDCFFAQFTDESHLPSRFLQLLELISIGSPLLV